MKKFAPLLLEIWREACRHIEIDASVRRIAPLLPGRLPVNTVIVCRLDEHRPIVEIAAAVGCGGESPPLPWPRRMPCSREALEALMRWCLQGSVQTGSAEQLRAQLPPLVPEGFSGPMAAGPLLCDGTPVGVLLVAGNRNFLPSHIPLLQALLEPLAIALENDRRVRGLQTLREAAEAKNRSLLSRLGRQDISESVIGAETGLREVMDRVALVSPAEAPVLIFGETGSGKEVVARAIHTGSRRAQGPFLRVNCGAIPPELVDSQLFGHERGSFTGAIDNRKGWFERSDGGTLFLDEVGELPPPAQVRLLRVLQDGTFERVGGQTQHHVDVRIVAATHRHLPNMVADGRFREDLWYRLSVFPIQIPPLRDRPGDIPALASHFALRAAQRLGAPALIPSPEDTRLLLSYTWPGNVRELAAVIERAVILGSGKELEIAAALGMGSLNSIQPALPAYAKKEATSDPAGWETLDRVIAHHIEVTLARCRGRIAGAGGAANLLGMHPNTLRARMQKLGVDWRRFHSRSEQEDIT